MLQASASWSMSSTNHQYLTHQRLITQYRFFVLELLKYRTKRHVMLRNYGLLYDLQVSLSDKGASFAILGVFSYHFRTFVSRSQSPYLLNYRPRLLVLLVWIDYIRVIIAPNTTNHTAQSYSIQFNIAVSLINSASMCLRAAVLLPYSCN